MKLKQKGGGAKMIVIEMFLTGQKFNQWKKKSYSYFFCTKAIAKLINCYKYYHPDVKDA